VSECLDHGWTWSTLTSGAGSTKNLAGREVTGAKAPVEQLGLCALPNPGCSQQDKPPWYRFSPWLDLALSPRALQPRSTIIVDVH